MSTELTMLAWTIVLGLVQLVIVAQFFTIANGLTFAMSSREGSAVPLTGLGGRLERAFRNLAETFPFAAAAILIAAAANRHNTYTIWGSELYFWGRVVYLGVYAAGIPALRTLVWLASVVGIILVLVGLVWG